MRTLKTSEAATLLNVSPNTLRAWERRFGFPTPRRSRGGHRLYAHGEVVALRDALLEGLSISSAVSVARRAVGADALVLAGALSGFEAERADAVMEATLALRTLERSVEEVLLPALAEAHRRHGDEGAAWGFAAGWASDWLGRARRLAPPPPGGGGLLVADACGGALDPDRPAVRALELFAARAGTRVLTLPVEAVGGLGDAVAQHRPAAIAVAGDAAGDDAVARWAYAARTAAGPAGTLPLALFRRPPHGGTAGRGRVGGGAHLLAEGPAAAAAELLQLVEGVAAPVAAARA